MRNSLTALLIAATASLAAPGPAQALTVTGPGADWGNRVLAKSQVLAPSGQVRLEFAACPGLEGTVYTKVEACWDAEHNTVYIDPQVQQDRRESFLHEVGHIYDDRQLDLTKRTLISPLLGRFSIHHAWSDCGSSANLDTYGRCAMERFADGYMFCAEGNRVKPQYGGADWESSYDYLPASQRQFRRLCTAIRDAV